MLRSVLPVLAAALWVSALSMPCEAQAPSRPPGQPRPAPPVLPRPGRPNGIPTPPPQAPTPTGPNDVIGRINDKTMTWTQFFDKLKVENPRALAQAVAQTLGPKVGEGLFGPHGSASYTVTRQDALDTLRQNPNDTLYPALQNLLIEDAIDAEATKSGITVTQAQVDAKLTKMFSDARKQGIIPASLSDDQFLSSRGISRAALAPSIKRQLLLYALVKRDLDKQLGHPIGPEDFFVASHILIQVPPAAQAAKPELAKKTREVALAKITRIETEIRAGKTTFEKAAKENSGDPSGRTGGSLGPSMRGQMVKPFEDAVFNLKVGQISKPVETRFGFHLIRLDKLGKDITPAERDTVLEQYEQNHVQSYIQTLTTQKYKIVNLLPQRPQFGGFPGARPQ